MDDSKADISNNAVQLNSWVKVPVLGEIACGQPILAEENIETNQFLLTCCLAI